MGLFEKKPSVQGTNSFGKPKLPQGQTATSKFQVLTYGETPSISIERWQFSVWGSVEEERQWNWDEFMKLP